MPTPLADPNSPDVHLADLVPRPAFLRNWEETRHRKVHWIFECLAEAGGAFCYCWFGMGAQTAYIVGNILGIPALGSVFTIGFGYGMGIILSLSVFGATSGGQFNPCVTIAFCVWKGFPWSKAPRYIISQILGAYVASLLVYAQNRTLILEAEAVLAGNGGLAALFTSQGPAGILGLYVLPTSNLGFVLLNEFICDVMLGLVIWATIDPTNVLVPLPLQPWVVAFAYASVIWGFSATGLAANTARDLGGRLAAMTIWGTQASGGAYGAIAALTNIPATLVAAAIYEFCFTDSSRIVPASQRNFIRANKLHKAHREMVSEGRYGHTTGIEAGSLSDEGKL